MSDDTPNADAVGSRAADWLSTVLSIPMIWPKATAALSVVAIVGSVLLVVQFSRPHVAFLPRPDARRVAEIKKQVRQAEERFRSQTPASGATGTAPGSGSGLSSGTDLSDAIFNPDHWRKHNESPRVHAD